VFLSGEGAHSIGIIDSSTEMSRDRQFAEEGDETIMLADLDVTGT